MRDHSLGTVGLACSSIYMGDPLFIATGDGMIAMLLPGVH
jgi:hypothetical protein